MLPKAAYINLLEMDTYADLSAKPQLLRERAQASDGLIIIDEVQRIPQLLNEIHNLIESKGIRFLITGSSARALRKRGVNLLGGRARSYHLHPFSWCELKDQFDINEALSTGLIPGIYFSRDKEADLRAYVGDYLREEIAAEGAVRNIPAFSRFLHVAGHCHGHIVNYEKVANDSRTPSSTVRAYFQIIRDTLIGYNLEAWRRGSKRKESTSSKFYFFDNGVAQHLQNRRQLAQGTPEYGVAFEAYIFHEIRTYIDYEAPNAMINFWRTTTNIEVDFVLDNRVAVEVKASSLVATSDLRGLKAIREESKELSRFIVVSLEPVRRIVDGIEIVPFTEFLGELWSGNLGIGRSIALS
jgi:predicted AAA+ superfamily ATPase